jgi:hypothetical protein
MAKELGYAICCIMVLFNRTDTRALNHRGQIQSICNLPEYKDPL